MCGICGYIGEARYPLISYDLATCLFEKTECRGEDASGFWGANEHKTIYHKEPTPSTQFVHTPTWMKVRDFNPNILLLHARRTSPGIGVPTDNINNHPFVNFDCSIGLTHNGRIHEYEILKSKYKVISQCDSEILLRIFENADYSLQGMADIWSTRQVKSKRSMVIAIGEKLKIHNRLWLTRNSRRSLWVVDLKESLGQYFFVSTDDIWESAFDTLPIWIQRFLSKFEIKLIEFPCNEVWSFTTDLSLRRFVVEKQASRNLEDVMREILPSHQKPVMHMLNDMANYYSNTEE